MRNRNAEGGLNVTEKIFCLKPQYLDDFKCDGSKCGALCCRENWNIFIDAPTYKKYSALPTPQAQEILRHLRGDSSSENFLVIREKNYCPFLGADNLCRIQKAHGEEYLSQVCAGYPRIITRFENFIELALSPTCPLAAKIILLRTEPLRFEVVEASEKILRLGECHILQGIPNGFAPLIIDLQLAMVAIFQERRLTLDQRLIVLGFFLDRIEELLYGGKLDGATLQRLSAVYTSENFLAQEVPLILRSVNFIPAEKNLPAEFATIAENFLVNEIFLSVYPFRIDASILQNFGVLLTVYKIFERRARDVQNVDELLTVADDLSHKIDHDGECLTDFAAKIDGDDLLTLIEKFLCA